MKNALYSLYRKNPHIMAGVFAVACGSLAYLYVGWHLDSQFKVMYSLDGRHNDQEVVKLIEAARSYAYFAIYYFTKDSIADALVRAKNRGVRVMGIMDREASRDSNKRILDKLISAGIPVETQKHPSGIMHMKLLVTDRAYASGSYNWTASATTENDEVLEIGTNRRLHDRYAEIIKEVLSANR